MYSGPASGLYTSPNPFSAVPAGSQKVADNVVFSAPCVIEPRRGFEELENSEFGNANSLADELFFYGSSILLAYDFTQIALRPADGSFTTFLETFEPNGTHRMRFEPAARCVFFNPLDGIRMWDGQGSQLLAEAAVVPGISFAFDGGSGTIDAGEVVQAAVAAVPTGEGIVVAAASTATGTLYLRDGITGTFPNNADLSGSPSFAAAVNGATNIVLFATPGDVSWWAVGQMVTGVTSGAVGVITVNAVVGAYRALTVTVSSGTFVSETVELSNYFVHQPVFAGNPQGSDMVAVTVADDPWMPADSAVAYRHTLCSKDAFGRITEGPPSGRVVLRNPIYTVPAPGLDLVSNVVTGQFTTETPPGWEVGDTITLSPGEAGFPAGDKVLTYVDYSGGIFSFKYAEVSPNDASTIAQEFSTACSVELTVYLQIQYSLGPTGDSFLRVYRSEATALASDTPSDELFQCYESGFLSLAELTVGYLEFTDVAPEAAIDVPLYTNPNTGDGSLAANFRPPIAEDIVYWQDQMWFLNTTDKPSAQLSLLGTGSPDGLQDGDTLSIVPTDNGGLTTTTLTAKTTPSAPGEFQVFTDGDPGYNIERTARALVLALNRLSAPVAFGFYVSGEDGLPGKILLQAPAYSLFGASCDFVLYSTRATPWAPQLPPEATPTFPGLASTNNRHAARVCFSKRGQPEAVPLLNYEQIDADNNPGLRIFPLNYRLLVFKTDGVYFIPTGGGFQKLSDHVLIAPDSVKRLGNAVFFLSDQGLMVVDDAGVRSVSVPIDDTLTALNGETSLTSLRERSVAVAYRSMEQYLLFAIERDELDEFTDDTAQAFVYSRRSNGFTRYSFGARCGAVDPDSDKLYLAPTDSNRLWVERKSLTEADYFDLDDAAIECGLIFNELTNEEPATMKMAQQCSFLFKQNSTPLIEALFASEIHPALVSVDLETAGFGAFSWGQVPWGGYVRTIRRVQPLPVEVANCCQLTVGIRASIEGTKFQFLGIDVDTKRDTKANHG